MAADNTVRELERAWKQTGTDDAYGAYLAALVRAGRFEQRKLEHAAFLGHAPARAAVRLLNAGPSDVTGQDVLMLASAEWMLEADRLRELRSFVGKQLKWGEEANYRTLIALAHVGIRKYEIQELKRAGVSLEARYPDGRLTELCHSSLSYEGRANLLIPYGYSPMAEREILEAAERWLVEQTDAAETALHAAAIGAGNRTWATALAASVATSGMRDLSMVATSSYLNDFHDGPPHEATRKDDREVRAEIRLELIPWIMGTADPVAERVRSRA